MFHVKQWEGGQGRLFIALEKLIEPLYRSADLDTPRLARLLPEGQKQRVFIRS